MNSAKGSASTRLNTARAIRELSLSDKAAVKESRAANIDPRLVCLLRPRTAVAESYSRLRLALETMREPERGFVVGVTSPGDGDGKSLTAINLAGALAQDPGARILLVDMDLRETGSSINDYLDRKTLSGPGVIDWIGSSEHATEKLVRYMPAFNLHVMSSGGKTHVPYELLKSNRLDEFIEQARRGYDFVILDTPKVLVLPDTELISRVVDGFLIVVRADRTQRKALAEALNLMTPDKVLGLVFNAVSDRP